MFICGPNLSGTYLIQEVRDRHWSLTLEIPPMSTGDGWELTSSSSIVSLDQVLGCLFGGVSAGRG